jgi:putative PIN family toxin of toxin-antitoxin system
MLKVVLDTNVIVSALNFSGLPAKVFDLAIAGEIANITSEHIITEVRNILLRKFSWEPAEAEDAGMLLGFFSKIVKPKRRLKAISHEPDNRILECAVAGKADFIISGDHHLTDLENYREIKIVNPNRFLEIIGRKQNL